MFLLLIILGSLFLPQTSYAKEITSSKDLLAKQAFSAVIADAYSGQIIHQKNSLEKKPIASMTKIMTLLVLYDNLSNGKINYEDNVVVSKNAANMGGSQAFLDAGSVHKVTDLIKTIIVASANDSCVALAEHLFGSTEKFVEQMNVKAKEINLDATNFVNCTGLPALNQYSCAGDCVKMFIELIKQENNYFDYSKIWIDDYQHPSGRITSLTNTNKLIRLYDGCDGGKTGYTNEAQHCLCATASRGDTRLIACVLGEPDSKTRFAEVSEMFNYGFANYENKVYLNKNDIIESNVKNGKINTIKVKAETNLTSFCKKGTDNNEISTITQFDKIVAPVKIGEKVGKAYLIKNNEVIAETNLISTMNIERKTYFDEIIDIIKNW